MVQLQIVDNDATVKESTSIHNIPEDVAEIIVDLVKGWAVQARGSEDRREVGRRERDSTLLGISQSCKNGRHLYHDHLLQNLTISGHSSLSLSQMFKNGRINGSKVKTLRCTLSTMREMESSTFIQRFQQIAEISQLPPPQLPHSLTEKASMEWVKHQELAHEIGLRVVMQTIYERLEHLEVLIVEDSHLMFLFLNKVGDRLIPQPFLTKSLKKLYIAPSTDERSTLSAKSVIFLLVFGEVLERVAIGFNINRESFRYLSEYASTFKGLSRVKELAISFRFIYEEQDPGSWWGGPSINRRRNRKTEALYDFLLVTNQLYSLEISDATPPVPDESASVEADCVSSLTTSSHSLRHLRIFFDGSPRPLAECFHLFKNLVNLSLNVSGLLCFYKFGRTMFPLNVSMVSLSYYSTQTVKEVAGRLCEEKYLKRAIESLKSTALTRVVVPELPIDYRGEVIEERQKWLEHRQDLENSVIFKEGKVKLIKYRVGDVIGLECKENPISMYRWLSP